MKKSKDACMVRVWTLCEGQFMTKDIAELIYIGYESGYRDGYHDGKKRED